MTALEDRLRDELATAARLAPDYRDDVDAPLRRPSRARRAVLGAVAAVVLVSGGAYAVHEGPWRQDHSPITRPGDVSGLPAPEAGKRWVSWHGVAVQVPDQWAYGNEPSTAWCLSESTEPPAAYVDLNPHYGAVPAIGCGLAAGDGTNPDDPVWGPAPETMWAEHVTLGKPTGPDGTWTLDGWTATRSTFDGVQVKVLSKDPDRAGPILESARPAPVDAAGCAASSPIQTLDFPHPDPVDLTSIREVDAVSVCQYDVTAPATEPGLMASRVISGAPASAYLRALRSAPVGGGPGDVPDCASTSRYDYGTGVVVRLWSGSTPRDLYVRFDYCAHNGIDTGDGLLTLTRNNCLPLFEEPVTLWQFQQALTGICTTS